MSNIDVKVVHGASVRRINVADTLSHSELAETFQELFELKTVPRLGYVDEDGDKVML
jgi:hypothetical protein